MWETEVIQASSVPSSREQSCRAWLGGPGWEGGILAGPASSCPLAPVNDGAPEGSQNTPAPLCFSHSFEGSFVRLQSWGPGRERRMCSGCG
ncbi:hypothetical protein KUCAC02_002012, partial [Chaenocephalus aceratus]